MIQNRVKKRIAAFCFAVSVLLGSTGGVVNAENTTKDVTISTTVSNLPSDYTFTIPAKTTISDFGETELSGGLKVSGTLAVGEHVEISVSSEHSFKLVSASDATKSIAYKVKGSSDDSAAVPVFSFSSTDLGQEKKVKVAVEQDEWNRVPAGTYSDVLVFQPKIVKE